MESYPEPAEYQEEPESTKDGEFEFTPFLYYGVDGTFAVVLLLQLWNVFIWVKLSYSKDPMTRLTTRHNFWLAFYFFFQGVETGFLCFKIPRIKLESEEKQTDLMEQFFNDHFLQSLLGANLGIKYFFYMCFIYTEIFEWQIYQVFVLFQSSYPLEELEV